MAPYTQDKRIGRLDTPFGKDQMVFLSIEAEEIINHGFEYRVQGLYLDPTYRGKVLDFDKAIGKHCTVTLKSVDGRERCFDGLLAEARWLESSVEGDRYELILRSWLWFASKRMNSRIFHQKTAPEIITAVFGDHPAFANYVNALEKTYPRLEYVAQYRESDSDFVCRLAEEHGISLHFEHGDGEHKLVMGDMRSAYKSVGKRDYIAVEGQHQRGAEHFSLWRPERKFTSGKVVLMDYDFKKPTANMRAEVTGDARFEHGELEVYDFPGRYVEQSDGQDYARARIEHMRAEDGRFHGEGDLVSLYPGAIVELANHPDTSQNREYLVLGARSSFKGESYRSGSGDTSMFFGAYELMQLDRPFAPLTRTVKAIARGPQTAVVTGKGDIDVDEYGRVQVRFHWDREKAESRRVRVAQVHAGSNWGGIFIPRVGMEVLVDFLEGDPDQPIVIGCLYNGDHKPPYALPDEKYVSGWKTDVAGGYNELVFDDNPKKPLVRMQAEKDLESLIKHDEKRTVDNDRTTTVKNIDSLNVNNELKIDVKSKITITCGQSSITMDPMSIKIEAPNIEIEATMSLKTNSKITAQHEASAAMTIRGAIVKIN